ncbi:MAG: biotin transporter BioY [Alphaproteobacteria bacterium]|nr:MAG: biotin transporter BioY [Alphaproteobacteria bacterium]
MNLALAPSVTTLSLPVRILAGTAVLILASKITVPFYPVPMTLQTLAVLALGLFAGFGGAVGAMLSYLALGAVGVQVFAQPGAAGLAHILGPTGGYLAGFLVAAALVGALADRGARQNGWATFGAVLAGITSVYLCGVAWLSQLVGVDRAITLGVVPFLYAEALKIAVLLAIAAAYRLRMRRHSA